MQKKRAAYKFLHTQSMLLRQCEDVQKITCWGKCLRSAREESSLQVSPDTEGVAEAAADHGGREALKGDCPLVVVLGQRFEECREVHRAGAEVSPVTLAYVYIPTCHTNYWGVAKGFWLP